MGGWVKRLAHCGHALINQNNPTQDYEAANKKNVAMTGVEDPVTYNNRGASVVTPNVCDTSITLLSKPPPYIHTANAEAGLGDYAAALKDYRKAAQMQPGYVFPLASAALTLYQLVCLLVCLICACLC